MDATTTGSDSTARERELGRRVRSLFASSRDLVAIAHRDPEHVPERLALLAVRPLGEPSLGWAESALANGVRADPHVLAGEQRRQYARMARIDGAIAGTPFFTALIWAYLGYLWQPAAMVLRIGALYGRDPRELRAAVEMLALRWGCERDTRQLGRRAQTF
jgi:hypothetical protein